MILTVDVGNTQIKSAVFEEDRLLEKAIFLLSDFKISIENIFKKFEKISVLVVASVGKLEKESLEMFAERVEIYFIDREKPFPFINNYATPHTLGIDRAVLAAGAVLQFPNQNRLIIDAGTCVTYDFVDAKNVYHGGAISPGIRLRYDAMHSYTAKLPLLEKEEPEQLIGNSTLQSMHSGVVNGLAFEIDGYIDALRTQNENFIIILTGGDANFLAKRLKNTIFANSNFLLESLNYLYQYQINND
ncbi:type III pantothenate kinase [Flavobacterium amniphilum]|uniref:type III pantothenate kinase n=1 Tax=Flavobacterium amniphilum TaxID=1834035 RepID=UPI00202A1FC6|nr:type III pantothenate kinase [Flavobacterium amniphilum]MCL9806516.1 type III pantothenate kinase [Flavobacterium amniphilum]